MSLSLLDDAGWFGRLGLPLDAAERAELPALLATLGSYTEDRIDVVGTWPDVARILDTEERDNRQWDASEGEREALWEIASDRLTEDALLERLRVAGDGWNPRIRAAAEGAAKRIGIGDARFVVAAAGAAQLALHHAELARLAEADPAHPFHRTLALFARGRWPLGAGAGRFILY